MNTQEIETILRKHKLTRKFFHGVFSSDKIPSKLKINLRTIPMKTFVFNLDPSYKSGSHWVALVYKKNGKHIFFDSYGWKPKLASIKNLLQNNFSSNTQQLQHPLTTVCGQWCIFFILYASVHDNIDKMYALFSKTNLFKNDHRVNYYINKMFKKNHKVIEKNFLKKQICKSFHENKHTLLDKKVH